MGTNTCCSHPLHGQQPSEVDLASDIASVAVPGVKRAAVRKLAHELGIDGADLPLECFMFLTRLHYCAADATEPEPDMWGEHELTMSSSPAPMWHWHQTLLRSRLSAT